MSTRLKAAFGGVAGIAVLLVALNLAGMTPRVMPYGEEEMKRDVARRLPSDWIVSSVFTRDYPHELAIGVKTHHDNELGSAFAETEDDGLSLPDREARRYPWKVTVSDTTPMTVKRVYRYSHDGALLERPANATPGTDRVADQVIQAIVKADLFR